MSGRYGKIKRHDLKNSIEREYRISIKSMHESDRGILAYTDRGIKLVRRLKKEDSKILFAASAYEYLQSRGFTNISAINRTEAGKCFFEYNGEAYVVQDYVNGRVFKAYTAEDAALAGRTLAQFHQACMGFTPASGCRARVDWGRWMEKFKAQAIYIKKHIEIVEAKAEPSRFDRLFLKYAGDFHEKMYGAYLMLKKHNYMGKVHDSMNCNQLTHKEFKKHAVIESDQGGLFITNMENCGYDIVEVDIATLLESFSGSNREELVPAALKGYSEVTPLDYDSIKIIQAFLVEPKKFYKLIQKYYGRKNDCTESETITKLERCVRRENKKDELICLLEDYEL